MLAIGSMYTKSVSHLAPFWHLAIHLVAAVYLRIAEICQWTRELRTNSDARRVYDNQLFETFEMRDRTNRPRNDQKVRPPEHVEGNTPENHTSNVPKNPRDSKKNDLSKVDYSSLSVPTPKKNRVVEEVPKSTRSLPTLDSPAVQNPCALLAWGGMVACAVRGVVRHLVPEADHTLANSLGDFPYTLIGIPLLLHYVISDREKFKAEWALSASVTWLVLAETGHLGILGGHSDPWDIPAGLVGAALGYILGRDGLKAFFWKVALPNALRSKGFSDETGQ